MIALELRALCTLSVIRACLFQAQLSARRFELGAIKKGKDSNEEVVSGQMDTANKRIFRADAPAGEIPTAVRDDICRLRAWYFNWREDINGDHVVMGDGNTFLAVDWCERLLSSLTGKHPTMEVRGFERELSDVHSLDELSGRI